MIHYLFTEKKQVDFLKSISSRKHVKNLICSIISKPTLDEEYPILPFIQHRVARQVSASRNMLNSVIASFLR